MQVIAGETFGWQTAEVLFNGAPLRYCLAADDQEGWVTCHRTEQTAHGGTRFVCGADGAPIVDILHGQVEIRGMPERET